MVANPHLTPPSQTAVVLHARGIRRVYRTDAEELEVLRHVDLEVNRGETIAITGASGVGKSTLLHILGTLDRPTAGDLQISRVDVLSLDDENLSTFRNRNIGFVFQFHNLLPEFTALENVMMPALIARQSDGRRARAESLLERVGLQDRMRHRPGELSGGECQRVAVARALVMSPPLVLADEPSGNLDHEASARLHDLLRELADTERQTFMVMTHDRELAARLDRTGHIADGVLELD
jgi:lipoprotein-releasing system ATP-binding protein